VGAGYGDEPAGPEHSDNISCRLAKGTPSIVQADRLARVPGTTSAEVLAVLLLLLCAWRLWPVQPPTPPIRSVYTEVIAQEA